MANNKIEMKLGAMYSGVDGAGNAWERPYATFRVHGVRLGWIGVWDAIRRAWTKEFGPITTNDLTFSLYVKVEDEKTSYVWGGQIESSTNKE